MKKRPLSEDTQSLLREAYALAREMGHSYVGTEHLMLAMFRREQLAACRVLTRTGWEAESFRSLLLSQTGRGSRRVPLLQGLSPRAKKTLRQAGLEAAMLNMERIEPEHLLLALTREERCTAACILLGGGTDLNCVFSDAYSSLRLPRPVQNDRRETTTKLLELYCENMLEKASRSDPVIGREKEISAVLQILCRKNKNNPALIGEPGVGKTAIVEGLAQRIAAGNVPEPLRTKRLFCLNMASVLAGTKYRGEFEERVRDILAEIRRCGNIILFVDEMHTLVGAGSAEGAIDAANLLKPALGRSELQMIGATTLAEYRKYIEKDAALERRFRPVVVREPSREEAKQMLLGLRGGLEAHHRIRITQEAIDAAVELSCRYLTDRFLPDKALDLLDESAARVLLREGERSVGRLSERKRQSLTQELEQAVSEGQYERAAVLRDRLQTLIRQQMSVTQSLRGRALDREDVAQTVAERTGIPAGKLTASECGKLLGLREDLRSRIVGQEQAVEEVSKAVLRGRAGLGERTRPAASLLFMGPTGVGKTELCKALADCVYGSRDALVRIDMTEYMEPNSVTRLIGAPPGYIGYEEGGTLTEKVRRRPYSVVLLDELEKAHRDVTGLLLQILEDGILTDSLGRTVDFKNTMIVMTSNLGSGESVKNGVGFTPGSAQDRTKRILRQAFPAELLGRIDCITTFRPLSQDDLAEIARRQLRQMVQRAALRGLELEISEEVCPYLAALCSQDDSGARSVRHRIQDMVETALSERLLQKDAPRRLTVAADENGISVLETMGAGG